MIWMLTQIHNKNVIFGWISGMEEWMDALKNYSGDADTDLRASEVIEWNPFWWPDHDYHGDDVTFKCRTHIFIWNANS